MAHTLLHMLFLADRQDPLCRFSPTLSVHHFPVLIPSTIPHPSSLVSTSAATTPPHRRKPPPWRRTQPAGRSERKREGPGLMGSSRLLWVRFLPSFPRGWAAAEGAAGGTVRLLPGPTGLFHLSVPSVPACTCLHLCTCACACACWQ